MGQSVILHPGNNGGGPGVGDPGSNLIHMNLPMISPVYHIICRKHHQGLDLLIGIIHLGALDLKLLVVVGAKQVQPAVILHCGGIGTEKCRGNRVVVIDIFKLVGADLTVCDGTRLLCGFCNGSGSEPGCGIRSEAQRQRQCCRRCVCKCSFFHNTLLPFVW